MGTKISSNIEPVEGKAGVDTDTPGDILRCARIDKGMQVDEVAMQLGLSNSRVIALEENNYEQLPSQVYVRGYIKRYCSVLGIASDPVIAGYEIFTGNTQKSIPEIRSVQVKVSNLGWLTNHPKLFLIVSVVITLLLMWVVQPGDAKPVEQPDTGDDSEQVGMTELPQSLPSDNKTMIFNGDGQQVTDITKLGSSDFASLVLEPPTVMAIAEQSSLPVLSDLQRLTLILGNNSWVEVVDANNDVLLADLKSAGSTIELQGKAPFDVVLGNAVNTRVSYLGVPVSVPVSPENNTARWVVGK